MNPKVGHANCQVEVGTWYELKSLREQFRLSRAGRFWRVIDAPYFILYFLFLFLYMLLSARFKRLSAFDASLGK